MESANILENRLRSKHFGVVGVGNVLKGDDGAGPAVVEQLQREEAPFPVVDAAEVPENYAGWVEKQRLDAVVFVDAVIMGAKPGEWRVIRLEDLMHSASNTHRLSLHFTIRYLSEIWRGDAIVLGIEPKTLALGEALSSEVSAAVQEIAHVLLSISGHSSNEKT